MGKEPDDIRTSLKIENFTKGHPTVMTYHQGL
jgi:hypothetical protein